MAIDASCLYNNTTEGMEALAWYQSPCTRRLALACTPLTRTTHHAHPHTCPSRATPPLPVCRSESYHTEQMTQIAQLADSRDYSTTYNEGMAPPWCVFSLSLLSSVPSLPFSLHSSPSALFPRWGSSANPFYVYIPFRSFPSDAQETCF
jgi:hypothetical protein